MPLSIQEQRALAAAARRPRPGARPQNPSLQQQRELAAETRRGGGRPAPVRIPAGDPRNVLRPSPRQGLLPPLPPGIAQGIKTLIGGGSGIGLLIEGSNATRELVEGIQSGDLTGAWNRITTPGLQSRSPSNANSGSRSKAQPTPGSLSPAPGAPGKGGQEYHSPYAGFRDATFSRIRGGAADGLVQPSSQPAAAPGLTQVPMGSPAARTERARRAEMLGNAGVQEPLPPPQDLKPYWERTENQAIRAAATPGGQGFVAPGSPAHSDRADILAWMEANKDAQRGADGRNVVDRYLLKELQRGSLGERGMALARARGLVAGGESIESNDFGVKPGPSALAGLSGFDPAGGFGVQADEIPLAGLGGQPPAVRQSPDGYDTGGGSDFGVKPGPSPLAGFTGFDPAGDFGVKAEVSPLAGLSGQSPFAGLEQRSSDFEAGDAAIEDLRGIPVSKMTEDQKKRFADVLLKTRLDPLLEAIRGFGGVR